MGDTEWGLCPNLDLTFDQLGDVTFNDFGSLTWDDL
jgi:hypothetical protein